MRNKTSIINRQELLEIVNNIIAKHLNEIDGKTYSRVRNSSIKAQNDRLKGIASTNPKKTNMDIIVQSIDLDPRAADSLITPFKDTYIFHGENLRSSAALVIFKLETLYELTREKAILKGNIIFNNIKLYGSIIVDMNTNKVSYNYKGHYPKYQLKIDPDTKNKWNDLLNELHSVINNWTI